MASFVPMPVLISLAPTPLYILGLKERLLAYDTMKTVEFVCELHTIFTNVLTINVSERENHFEKITSWG